MELRDDYSVPDEDDPFADWMRGVVDNSYGTVDEHDLAGCRSG
ncbi:hypothetical protein [Streptomyces sp. NPDC059552]